MDINKEKTRIAILGGGPAGLFMYKRLIETGRKDYEIHIFERKQHLGAGMPYSCEGANDEHITNVSGNEIPDIVTTVEDWIQTLPSTELKRFGIERTHFNDYKVLPRLLFGQYLSAQFGLLVTQSEAKGMTTTLHLGSNVIDVTDAAEHDEVCIEIENARIKKFDCVIICTGHNWPKRYEGKIAGYFDAPYPPSKLALQLNHPVAIKGSSLTAIDAIRTLARHNGSFIKSDDGKLTFDLDENSEGFKIMMHSRSGLLPAVRFHLEDSHLQNSSLLTSDEIAMHRQKNDGFLALDFVFEKDFKRAFLEKDPEFYQRIKHMSIEEFVADMMELRERLDPFLLLKAEYAEAEQSIKRKESVYWKEMLAVLSFAMNYPAKYLSAEDMLRLQKVLMPLISIVIAFIPQASCRELMAMHDAGILDIVPVGPDSEIEINEEGGILYNYTDEEGNAVSNHYKTFVDCVGQPHLSYDDFPFKGLIRKKTISPALLKFQSAEAAKSALSNGNKSVIENSEDAYYLKVSGITINDHFQVVDQYGAFNRRIYIMAVPYIGGFNPDYSGLDFCEAASQNIIIKILETFADADRS